ncbi:hypothetical protein LGR54_19680 [Ancylobacter sp. Lp-2]|uniref:hypothetical protein n=1 Tax=Ancylobacter sp. Lp-2 TaxID=2881339 RepID=UPI001E5A5C3D|nr:hypothetical protein [Ancylobacter sp. Lp-2]MCB4770837.1 hypothetical protein [Ancylobacter sp. Lp-2]
MTPTEFNTLRAMHSGIAPNDQAPSSEYELDSAIDTLAGLGYIRTQLKHFDGYSLKVYVITESGRRAVEANTSHQQHAG